jgi:hypothetical protein
MTSSADKFSGVDGRGLSESPALEGEFIHLYHGVKKLEDENELAKVNPAVGWADRWMIEKNCARGFPGIC